MENKKAPANEGSLPGLAKKDTYIIAKKQEERQWEMKW